MILELLFIWNVAITAILIMVCYCQINQSDILWILRDEVEHLRRSINDTDR